MMSPSVRRPGDRTSNHGSCRSHRQEQGKVLHTGVGDGRDRHENRVAHNANCGPAHEEETSASVFVRQVGGGEGCDETEDVSWVLV